LLLLLKELHQLHDGSHRSRVNKIIALGKLLQVSVGLLSSLSKAMRSREQSSDTYNDSANPILLANLLKQSAQQNKDFGDFTRARDNIL
jgi:hypothetical protein